MKRLPSVLITIVALSCFIGTGVLHQPVESEAVETAHKSRLAVLWTSGDPEVAHNVCLMYTHAAQKQKWFDQVVLIVWGPSARLLSADKKLQAKIKTMLDDGVTVQACIVCADSYGVTERLRELGVEVKGMGRPLTDMIKQGWKILTF